MMDAPKWNSKWSTAATIDSNSTLSDRGIDCDNWSTAATIDSNSTLSDRGMDTTSDDGKVITPPERV